MHLSHCMTDRYSNIHSISFAQNGLPHPLNVYTLLSPYQYTVLTKCKEIIAPYLSKEMHYQTKGFLIFSSSDGSLPTSDADAPKYPCPVV